jgi:hypothetical protein
MKRLHKSRFLLMQDYIQLFKLLTVVPHKCISVSPVDSNVSVKNTMFPHI